jgi:hypothetical protein
MLAGALVVAGCAGARPRGSIAAATVNLSDEELAQRYAKATGKPAPRSTNSGLYWLYGIYGFPMDILSLPVDLVVSLVDEIGNGMEPYCREMGKGDKSLNLGQGLIVTVYGAAAVTRIPLALADNALFRHGSGDYYGMNMKPPKAYFLPHLSNWPFHPCDRGELEAWALSDEGKRALAASAAPPPPTPSTPLPTPSTPPRPAPTVEVPPPPERIGNIHVLCIGVGDFDDKAIPPVPYAKADAKAVYDFFSASRNTLAREENVHLVTTTPNSDGLSATREGIMKAIGRYLVQRAVKADDLVILFYAGHGDQDGDGRYYWVPSNASRGELLTSGLPESEVYRLLEKVPAKHRLLLVDACHAGALSEKRDLKVVGPAAPGLMLIASCEGSETSVALTEKGAGVFTQVLLEGLSGSADSAYGDLDKRVTLGELTKWLKDRVPPAASKAQPGSRQTPVIKMPPSWEGVFITR